MELNKNAIFDLLISNKSKLIALGVSRLGLFGSYVRNTSSINSDIDLLIEFRPGCKNFDHFMQICALLEDSLPYPVDILTMESISPYIKPHILKDIEYVTFTA